MKYLKPMGTKASSHVENGDVELQYNIFTISTLIVFLECDHSTKQRDGFLNISLEVFELLLAYNNKFQIGFY